MRSMRIYVPLRRVTPLQTQPLNYLLCRDCPSLPHLRQRHRLSPPSRNRRQYSGLYSAPPHPPPSGFAHLSSRRLISLRGPDSSHYLQGVITANISSSSHRSTGFFAAFLNAQGRVLNDVFIYRDYTVSEDAWLIEVDATEASTLYKHIKRYKLRAKFEVRLLDATEMGVWSVWKTKDRRDSVDGSATWTAHTIGGYDRIAPHEIGCVDVRAPGMGLRQILPGSKKPQIEEGVEEASEDSYRIRRYLSGVAEGQSEILKESALPQESNIDFMGGIDYRKGCYVGQELTIRTHHTGVIRKRILPLMIYSQEHELPEILEYKPSDELYSPPAETVIVRCNRKGRSAGKWLAGVGNIGLGLCRLETMTNTIVQGEAGSYIDGDEFKSEWTDNNGSTKMVKVKAFIPPWHLAR